MYICVVCVMLDMCSHATLLIHQAHYKWLVLLLMTMTMMTMTMMITTMTMTMTMTTTMTMTMMTTMTTTTTRWWRRWRRWWWRWWRRRRRRRRWRRWWQRRYCLFVVVVSAAEEREDQWGEDQVSAYGRPCSSGPCWGDASSGRSCQGRHCITVILHSSLRSARLCFSKLWQRSWLEVESWVFC